MYPDVDNLVQNQHQMALATFKVPPRSEYCWNKNLERKPSIRRRVFVQTESGSVLGIELDSSDNAHTVKKKLQVALNVPTDESSLVYGDMVLKDDLSAVRNDSPLLLTRNLLHRSSSSPCMSPNARDLQQRDQSGPIEILGCSFQNARTQELVMDIVEAINNGIDPVPVRGGLGGAYYFKNLYGENIAIVKPTDEEPYAPNNPKGFVGKALGQPGLKRSVRVGETGFREVAAYLLDYDNFANVPSTALVKVTHSIFNVNDGVKGNVHRFGKQVSKIASLQQFISHDYDASDHGTSSFPVAAVHRIGILDIRILNTDRHAGNLLVRKLDGVGSFGQVDLVPIDHGFSLPECLEDPYFEWIHWPQASIPFSEDELEYIDKLDPFCDSEMLRMELPMIREACLRVLVLCTIFLKEAAVFGLCLAEIGEMMSREFRGLEEEPSQLELICMEARKLVQEEKMHTFETKKRDEDDFQFFIDSKEYDLDLITDMKESSEIRICHSTSKGGNDGTLLCKLEVRMEEKDEGSEEDKLSPRSDEYTDIVENHVSNTSKLSKFSKSMNIDGKSRRHEKPSAMQKTSYLAGPSLRNKSVNEKLPVSSSFVKLADLNEEDWMQFLDKFRGLLCPAFANRKTGSLGQRQRQRLGTSF
ncbi:phosphatidylinositol 4-kinase gamma 5-like [Humulus lupulus]|uniref:phosphatidylinositol 4-kinase gamma 5-like n=1 Tax=Humulus lupulus TaxID=3486 RepID=UPI002B405166|nr:phosphatidylinositol 4-kinase gamma 5-like [Humulus lupulus]XP_062106420.1 phosphatidylinositol 4-kinase gamma 5-like [Humulus lupulus]XP_062106421.1 phosphatidylinositol 4-kinase gamma 5-like [Humulus lupulus]